MIKELIKKNRSIRRFKKGFKIPEKLSLIHISEPTRPY